MMSLAIKAGIGVFHMLVLYVLWETCGMATGEGGRDYQRVHKAEQGNTIVLAHGQGITQDSCLLLYGCCRESSPRSRGMFPSTLPSINVHT